MLFTELFNVFVRIAGKLGVSSNMKTRILTDIDESARLALAELPGLVGEGDLHDSRDVAGRGLYPGEVWCRTTQPHSLWHAQSAAGLLDFFLLVDRLVATLQDLPLHA